MATTTDGSGTMALAAFSATSGLKKHELGRPNVAKNDVSIDISFCGMCHSDLHATNGDWGMTAFPIAPGHEVGIETSSTSLDYSLKFPVINIMPFDHVTDCWSCTGSRFKRNKFQNW